MFRTGRWVGGIEKGLFDGGGRELGGGGGGGRWGRGIISQHLKI